MQLDLLEHARGQYALATGVGAAYRLQLLHQLYGAGTKRALLDAGIRLGMRVADLGCGIGTVTTLMAEIVGPEGCAIGVDYSGQQLEQARASLPAHVTNVDFVEASATDTGLPRGSFDLVYCRFLLLHLEEPELALREMRELLKPGGILLVEDGDLLSASSEPASELGAFADLFGRLGPIRGVDYSIARRLYGMVLAAGFTSADATFNQPVTARGELKRLLELSVAEAGPSFVSAGLVSSAELERTLTTMRRLADDETVLAIMPCMRQVWARKPVE
jgi:SAM-dependent methyltransferase